MEIPEARKEHHRSEPDLITGSKLDLHAFPATLEGYRKLPSFYTEIMRSYDHTITIVAEQKLLIRWPDSRQEKPFIICDKDATADELA